MRRFLTTVAVFAMVAVGAAAYAQERVGAGRVEVAGFPIGGMFFTGSTNDQEPKFDNYALGAAFTYNFTRYIGVEGEFGNSVGVHQNITFGDTVLTDQRSPSMYAYTGNIVYNPIGNARVVVPYLTGGAGGMTLREKSDIHNLGVTDNTSYFTGNAGGGVKWFAHRYFGLRGDYRLVMVNDKATAPEFFGRQERRYGHRIYGGLLFTY
jgi:outer membrane beta-barrel protein